MSYTHIANLRGAEGARGISAPILLTSSDNVDELEPDVYQVDTSSVSAALGLPGSNVGYLEVVKLTASQRIQYFTKPYQGGPTSPLRIWVRGMNFPSNNYREWELIYPDDNTDLGARSISGRIKELAARDGWLAVYDPTDMGTTDLDSYGRVREIRDGLGNLPPLESPSGERPMWLPGEYGQLAGMDGTSSTGNRWIRVTFGRLIPQPTTYMMVTQSNSNETTHRFLLDGTSSWPKQSIFIRQNYGPSWGIFAGQGNHGTQLADTNPHIITASFNGTNSFLDIDSQSSHYGANTDSDLGTRGIRLGSDNAGERRWAGTYGPVLIHDGNVSDEAITRMQNLLHSATQIPKAAPNFFAETRAYSETSFGQPTISHGAPNGIAAAGIASLTKVMTIWVANQWVSDLDSTVTVLQEDLRGSRFQAGDVVSYRDLFYAVALPSDNAAPDVIARSVGNLILSSENSSGDGRSRFIEEMNAEASRLDYEGARFTGAVGSARMSPLQLVDLFRRTLEDSALRQIYSTRTHAINVTGPNSRTINVSHTIHSTSNDPFPEFIAGKTGTFGGRGHLVMVWEHPDGSEHLSVVTDTFSSDAQRRYREMRKIITSVKNGATSVGTMTIDPPDME